MANGEKIYNKSGSGLAIEKDKMYHVAPLPAEIIEIQKTKSHLRMTQGIVLGS
jgi:phosphotransferase system IIA component